MDLNAATSQAILENEVSRMSKAIAHRGPDGSGIWADERLGIALAHRRLSILDLSPTGAQPMESARGRYVISFNGEIYNFQDLRKRLVSEGTSFRGTSDTEVLVNSIELWGVKKTLPLLEGMFAFAVFDRHEKILHLARDRFGEKPLAYGCDGNYFWFSSELSSFPENSFWKKNQTDLNKEIYPHFLSFGNIPAPHTIYRNVKKLLPGYRLEVPLNAHTPLNPEAYYTIEESIDRGYRNTSRLNDEETADQLESLLSSAIARQMVADVPHGAFLSGGIDSSTVVAIMQKISARPVKTFTIGFQEKEYDESMHAKAVAKHLGTDHHELIVSEQDAIDVVPKLMQIYDEPFADTSQIPTYLLAKLTRSQVTVSLSGDGGDELFGGYNRYLYGPKLWRRMRPIPSSIRIPVAKALSTLSDERLQKLLQVAALFYPRLKKIPQLANKAKKAIRGMGARNEDELYYLLQSVYLQHSFSEPWGSDISLADSVSRQQYFDFKGYLPNDILTKVDRATMAVGLESRIPFLSPSLVDFAWSLPLNQKIRSGQGKWILRQVLYRHVPQKIMDRPKMGFAIPISSWLRGALKEWGSELVAKADFDWANRCWSEHQSGKNDHGALLWSVLMLQSWLEGRSKDR